jgi:FkbH-like protein
MEMLAGFPYSLKHADAVAFALAGLLHPPTAKKGLIVDLDDTLWGGILGEVGPENVSWHQEHGTQVHALLQQMLGQLAENGVLLAIASKNEYGLVRPALKRGDLLLPAESFFPVIANWERKSAAVSEILAVWNVAADSVVFLDDNPMELEEVQSVFPTIGALRFTPKDPAAVWKLLAALRELFGKAEVHAEDGLRSSSIRAAADLRNAARDAGQDTSGAGFLASLGGCVGIDYRIASADKRYLELINKTNQFNLNGVRMTEDEWLTRLRADGTIVIGVVYEDKFGPLGKIAVLLGQRQGDGVWVASWVMSCRAFSRRIEYHLLDSMFRELGVENLVFDFRATGRNQPLQNLFRELGVSLTGDGPLRLFRKDFQGKYELPHEIRRLA